MLIYPLKADLNINHLYSVEIVKIEQVKPMGKIKNIVNGLIDTGKDLIETGKKKIIYDETCDICHKNFNILSITATSAKP